MAVEGEVKLIGSWASPFVARPRIALNLKGIEYEFLEEEVLVKKSDLLLKSNPVYKKIPVLIHAGNPICESLIILEYINEVWSASPILPSDSFHRAAARFWAAYIDDKLSPPIRLLLGDADEDSKKGAKDQISAALLQLEEAFAESRKGRSFFGGGDDIGMVDIVLGSYIPWLKAMDKIAGMKFVDEEKIPGLVEWAERFCSAAVTKDVLPQPEKVVEFSKVVLAFRRAAAAAAASPHK